MGQISVEGGGTGEDAEQQAQVCPADLKPGQHSRALLQCCNSRGLSPSQPAAETYYSSIVTMSR